MEVFARENSLKEEKRIPMMMLKRTIEITSSKSRTGRFFIPSIVYESFVFIKNLGGRRVNQPRPTASSIKIITLKLGCKTGVAEKLTQPAIPSSATMTPVQASPATSPDEVRTPLWKVSLSLVRRLTKAETIPPNMTGVESERGR